MSARIVTGTTRGLTILSHSLPMLFDTFVLIVSAVAAAIASITGFGIGSLLTPTLAIATGTKVAVAAVSLPHFVGTAIRFVMLRASVDRRVLWRFGLASAAGGLTGALLHRSLGSPWLSAVFGLLLIFVAVSELTGLARRMKFHGSVSLVAVPFQGCSAGWLRPRFSLSSRSTSSR